MRNQKWKFFAERSFARDSIDVHVAIETENGRLGVLRTPTVMIHDEPAPRYGEPLLELSLDAAAALMDELWRAGVRPSNGAGSTGQLAATERHLEDMRTLVFGGSE